jgi:nucleoside-diphosphate-sugar epimerase
VSTDLRDARVLVTGGTGFLGKHLCRALDKVGSMTQSVGSGLDLTWGPCVEEVFRRARPAYVFHLAGWNGGISFNENFPADIFFRNTLMGLNVLEACRTFGVKKVVSVVASCAYPGRMRRHREVLPTRTTRTIPSEISMTAPHISPSPATATPSVTSNSHPRTTVSSTN